LDLNETILELNLNQSELYLKWIELGKKGELKWSWILFIWNMFGFNCNKNYNWIEHP
jgi:hypothetical protein